MRFICIGYNLNVMQQSTYLVFNTITVHVFAALFNLEPMDRASDTGPAGSVVEHPLWDREVVGSNPGRAIPKVLKWYKWLPCLVISIIRQALASLLQTHIAQLTSQHLQR